MGLTFRVSNQEEMVSNRVGASEAGRCVEQTGFVTRERERERGRGLGEMRCER